MVLCHLFFWSISDLVVICLDRRWRVERLVYEPLSDPIYKVGSGTGTNDHYYPKPDLILRTATVEAIFHFE